MQSILPASDAVGKRWYSLVIQRCRRDNDYRRRQRPRRNVGECRVVFAQTYRRVSTPERKFSHLIIACLERYGTE